MKLYATTDFVDEMVFSGAWTRARLAAYFNMLRAEGISRLYWIDQ